MRKVRIIFGVLFSIFISVLPAQHRSIQITETAASSQMPDYPPWSYGPEQALDGDPLSAWVEGDSGHGLGEFIELELEHVLTIDAVSVMPGFFDSNYFYTNNRVKTFEVTTNNEQFTMHFSDVMSEQIHHLDPPIRFDRIRFEIADIYEGRDPDTCVAEISFYSSGRKIEVLLPGAPQHLSETKYYRTGTADSGSVTALRNQYMIHDYGEPQFIIYREAFNLSLLTEISRHEFLQDVNKYCEEECIYLKIEPGGNGLIKRITAAYNYMASTGVVTRTFEFGSDGVLSAMHIRGDTAMWKPVQVHRSEVKGGWRLVIKTEMEYYQGGVGEKVTVTHTIDYDDRHEITYHYADMQREDIYNTPPEDSGP